MTIKAVNPEVVISVDAKCCAGVTPESHANALAAMKVCQIQVEEQSRQSEQAGARDFVDWTSEWNEMAVWQQQNTQFF